MTEKIPQELLVRAIRNVTERTGGHSLKWVELLHDEVARLMSIEHPGAKVTHGSIRTAVRLLVESNNNSGAKPSQCLVAKAINPNGITAGELEKRFALSAGFVKLMMGVANNAALAIMYYCHNKIADVRDTKSYEQCAWHPHPRYRHRVKQLFKQVFFERDRYRANLKNTRPDGGRFFNISEMPESTRKKYGVVTDAQYYEFWEGTGALAIQKSQPLIGSLWNKFRLSLVARGVGNADLVAWGCVGSAVLELAVTVWQRTMRSVCEDFGGVITIEQTEKMYAPFNITKVLVAWQRALEEMAPEVSANYIDDCDKRNVLLGVEQLLDLWTSPDLPFDSTIQAVKDFSELFSKKGAKQAVRELAEMRNRQVSLEENKRKQHI